MNKPTSITIVIFLFCAASCSTKKKDAFFEPKIAKTVPANFISATDGDLTKRKDTIFYKNQLFSGFAYTLYADGDTASLQSYFNGVEEGTQKKWYPDKQPAEERFYINGKKEGTHKGWWPNGKPKFLFFAYNDEYAGEFKEWYASGLPGKDFHYVKGQEEGSQKLWWDNGTIRANYVIREGKKYGLIGIKLCVNPNDSANKK